ncbi:MAG: ribonuclease HII [Patescibacteria group bacterium]|nr:ribonuclease HII [Patescibacteria group bacterium]
MKPGVDQKPLYIIGIDEVGRGPIAGPVAVGAFVILNPAAIRTHFRGVRESKQLTEPEREAWFAKIFRARESGHVDFAVTFKSERIIDTRGLSYAIRTALKSSLNRLQIDCASCRVLLDGGLKAPKEYADQKTIIKGDEKEKVIALASICAKVMRDRYMNRLAKKHPAYGFEKHKGYGTRSHYLALNKFGLLPFHRRSFLKTFARIK